MKLTAALAIIAALTCAAARAALAARAEDTSGLVRAACAILAALAAAFVFPYFGG